ncbi:MAG: DUF3095 family protein [Nonlabens sp.]|uniref:DUF3095 family protein n=1 Tax=Nonlabens sp. TaxID=1888209 RepID=UPI003EF93809
MKSTKHFYSSLKANKSPVHKLVRNDKYFCNVPQDWHVVVADVKDSTYAVANGFHNEVNLAATGSVVTVINQIKGNLSETEVPYFFGGDGATFLVHDSFIEEVNQALETYRIHVEKNLALTLIVGSMRVSKIIENGYSLRLAKSKLNKYLTVPVVLGHGLKFAESQIKNDVTKKSIPTNLNSKINLNGMECRWDEISPKQKDHKVLCLLVNTVNEDSQTELYSDILDIITLLFGTLSERTPISVNRLKLKATLSKIKKEMIARIGQNKLSYLLKHWIVTNFGGIYFKYFKEGQQYLSKVSLLSDTIMIDGSLNMVIEGSTEQIERLENYLKLLEQEGKIKYGVHITYASVMSCYVQDRKENHIHFVDGTEGGYTSAAIIYKSKLEPVH